MRLPERTAISAVAMARSGKIAAALQQKAHAGEVGSASAKGTGRQSVESEWHVLSRDFEILDER
jgi:hypothetical protein